MPFTDQNNLRYYTFPLLAGAGVTHGVFTRRGGVSAGPWASLNLGGTVGDEPEHVHENRRRAFDALQRRFDSLFDVWQVHSDVVVCTDRSRRPDEAHLQADAIITNQPGVTLFMRFADCVPILLFDPHHQAIGLAHAGWKGAVNHIAARTVEQMSRQYGSRPAEILAGIGPSIGPHHYEVGSEVIQQVHTAFGPYAAQLLPPGPQRGTHFDLWQANRLVLEQAGVQQIEISGLCTACTLQDWYSHRGENGRTGRFGALIGL
jgi:YfiH family protein